MASPFYLGSSPEEQLGNSPRYWYALRKNQDGELFFVRSDQLVDNESYVLNIPGPVNENFEDFETGVDYLDGIDEEHEKAFDNLFYPQYRWDNRPLFYYVDDDGNFVQRLNKSYTYPSGISS